MNKTTPDISIDIAIDSEYWGDEQALRQIVERACEASKNWLIEKRQQALPDSNMELSLLFTDDSAMRKINAQWREIDKPTNVLSFPLRQISPGEIPEAILGDIIFAHETISKEAIGLKKDFDEHLTHLFIHGFLHLFGYDHIEDDEAQEMEAIETGILASLNLSDPYETNREFDSFKIDN